MPLSAVGLLMCGVGYAATCFSAYVVLARVCPLHLCVGTAVIAMGLKAALSWLLALDGAGLLQAVTVLVPLALVA